ncbi:Ca2+-dependent phosphoinositide-specific phospholipase C [Brytella acorum]|uniref:Ca2+-dependent phosphoinositide-specific phospholipase C n=1 Tax=Brytella acorum TaxID=2959299 RepID=A0AA35UH95_9PROT|nr:Ca2+-dependent phosphoinositide-specific phospholipase C [Brytella acorum]MDF3625667.1 Ca2+-dependent phosphoinositide-specific phospholipase C [Brytella acorum]CAI9121296.1 Ca2+-dependent phosphoinositide-specific phospholipase C [Brytella acorum]
MTNRLPLVAALAATILMTGHRAEAAGTFDPSSLRLDQLQVVGSHNSYHAGLEQGIRTEVERANPDFAALLDYAHPALSTQLDRGVRQLELDIYADSQGGRFANPHRPGHPEEKWALPPAELALMRQPGLKVMHIPDIDQHATCEPLKACLKEVQAWSHAHPGHIPVFIILEIEQSNDVPGATPVERFSARTFDQLDATIRSVFSPGELLTPDQARGTAATLGDAIRQHGWPTVGDSRGKIAFLLDQRDNGPLYLAGHPSLRGRVAFTNAAPDAPDAAFTELNDGPAEQITALVRRHLLVRTRADVNTVEGRSGSVTRRNLMLASGAQIISTDYPQGEAARWSGYRVGFPGGGPARCNPVTAPANCVSRLLEPPGPDAMRLRRVVVVMRHGIRSALPGQEPAGTTIAGGWPQWEVAPGDLTPHGATGMRTIGRFERRWLEENDLMSGDACPAPDTVSLHANSEPRTVASALAFVSGFAAGCPLPVTHLAAGTPDPLFSALEADPSRFDMRAIVPRLPVADTIFARHADALATLGRIVQCGKRPCTFLKSDNHVEPDASNHALTLSGPIREGSSIAEALMLAYLDGKPLIREAGHIVDVGELGALSALHAAMLDSIVRPRPIGALLSRDLRARLVDDLSAPTGPAFRLYVGHDDTIAPLLGMMDTHVLAPGYAPDEIPVGSALVFAVYGNASGKALIRVLFQSQTPEALRNTPDNADPSISFPHVPACRSPDGLCTPEELLPLLRTEQAEADPLSNIQGK